MNFGRIIRYLLPRLPYDRIINQQNDRPKIHDRPVIHTRTQNVPVHATSKTNFYTIINTLCRKNL